MYCVKIQILYVGYYVEQQPVVLPTVLTSFLSSYWHILIASFQLLIIPSQTILQLNTIYILSLPHRNYERKMIFCSQ